MPGRTAASKSAIIASPMVPLTSMSFISCGVFTSRASTVAGVGSVTSTPRSMSARNPLPSSLSTARGSPAQPSSRITSLTSSAHLRASPYPWWPMNWWLRWGRTSFTCFSATCIEFGYSKRTGAPSAATMQQRENVVAVHTPITSTPVA